jgi:16S rRNA processing protein RimM
MAYKKSILLGRITKVHGFQGAVTIRLERNISDNISGMESVFIETDGRLVPFLIDYIEQLNPSTLRMKFEGYNSTEKIEEFAGCKLYHVEPVIPVMPVDDPHDLIKYEVISDQETPIGIITRIIEYPGHLLLNIMSESGKEILLPLHEDLIIGIDNENKIIRMILPDGIADIN